MPIDARIPLGSQAPQMPDIGEQYGRMMQLKNMAQQSKLGDMQLQQAEQEQREQQIIQEAYGAVGGDLDKLHDAVAGKVSPKAAQSIKSAATEQRQKLLTLDSTEFDLNKKKLDRVGNVVNGLLSMDDASLEASWPQIRAQVIQSGDADEETVPEQYPGRKVIQMYSSMIDGGKAAMTRAEEERKAAAEKRAVDESAARLPGIKADTGQKVAKQQAMTDWLTANPGTTAADYEIDVAKRKAPTNEWDLLKAAGKGDREAKNTLTQKTLQIAREEAAKQNAQGTGGANVPYSGSTSGEKNESILKGLPAGEANTVKMMVEGRIPLPSGFALSKPYWQKMLNLAAQYEPGFDATQWRVRLDTRVDFAKGKAAQNVRSLNTLVDHLGKLTDSIKELDNSSFPIWNSIANWSASQTGDPRITKFNTAAQAVESEAVNVFKGTGATDQEIKEMRANFDKNGSPQQQMEAARTVMSLAFGRLRALESQYEQAFRKARDFKFLNNSARKVLRDKLGIDPDVIDSAGSTNQDQASSAASTTPKGTTISVTAPDGSVHQFPDEVSANKFRQLAGIK